MSGLRERIAPLRTSSQPALPRLVRKQTKQLVRQQASLDSVLSPEHHTPEHVVIESVDPDGTPVSWKVFVAEVGGVKTLDLYCGWSQENKVGRPPLTKLPNQVCDLLYLQRLWISHNQLINLPPNFSRLSQLTELFLHYNQFNEFPIVLCNLSSLNSLWLSHNCIPSIPNDITNLSLLRRLHLDHNQIEIFPACLTLLPNLQFLYLNHNSLKSLSEDIGRMKAVRHLLLHCNRITEVPRGITELGDIERLDLSENLLKHLSKEFRSFQTIKNADKVRVSTVGNPLDKAMVRMNSIDHTSPSLRPRTMSFPLSGHTRRKSDSTPSPTPSPSGHTRARRHFFIHSQSEDRM